MQDESWVVKDEEALRQDDGDKLQAIQAFTATIYGTGKFWLITPCGFFYFDFESAVPYKFLNTDYTGG